MKREVREKSGRYGVGGEGEVKREGVGRRSEEGEIREEERVGRRSEEGKEGETGEKSRAAKREGGREKSGRWELEGKEGEIREPGEKSRAAKREEGREKAGRQGVDVQSWKGMMILFTHIRTTVPYQRTDKHFSVFHTQRKTTQA